MAGLGRTSSFVYRLTAPLETSSDTPAPAALTWEFLKPAEAGRLRDIGPFEAAACPPWFERGDLCYLGFWEGRLAHYSWVQRSGVHPFLEAGLQIPVKKGDFWIYYCRTADWARGQGIYPLTLRRIVREHFAEGYTTAWIYTTRQNVASQRGILRAGFTLAETRAALRFGQRHYRLGGLLD